MNLPPSCLSSNSARALGPLGWIFPLLTACLFCQNLAARADAQASPTAAERPNLAERPNVIVFLVDDMGVMDTSVPFLTDGTGNPKRYPLNDWYRTPAMERLASRGVRFPQFYAMSVCSPSRIAIMTGQNAALHRTTNWIAPDHDNAGPRGPKEWNWKGLDQKSVTLARQFQSAGYRTIHLGKGHFGPRGSIGSEPTNLGFDVNIGGASIGQPGSYYGTKNFGNAGGTIAKATAHAVPHLEKYYGSEIFLTEALTREAKDRITEAVNDQQPFFLHLAHYAVHAPFQSDPRFEAHYRDSGKSPQAQAFATLIEGMDQSLGDVLDHLEALGVAQETLVLFLGDNGSDGPLGGPHEVACAAPLRGKKGSHYEGGMRVPFIAAWAKPSSDHPLQKRLPIAVGTIQNQVASVCDLFPTLLELIDQPVPANHIVDGHSLVQLLSGQPDPARNETFCMHYPHAVHRSNYWTSYREGQWKVIYHYLPSEVSENSHYQLFDLAVDPFEQTNLTTSQGAVLRRMMQSLITVLEEQRALYPRDDDGISPLKPVLP